MGEIADIDEHYMELNDERDPYDADTRDEVEMDYLLLQRELKVWEAARNLATTVWRENYSGIHSMTGLIIGALDDKVQEVKGGKTQV